MSWNDFIPCTKPVSIGDDIYYRPHKHWGMNIWAGEGLYEMNGDASGCLHKDAKWPLGTCSKPIVVMQRIYWNGKKQISAVLSYPNGLSIQGEYFWEIYGDGLDDIERFFDSNAEEEMETRIKELLIQTQT